MWELPAVPSSNLNGKEMVATFRHSITDTDYKISVVKLYPKQVKETATHGRWFGPGQWQRLALTGLARKILRTLRA
jgi:histone acetyltransferase (RNA polymerase elongator complex component)